MSQIEISTLCWYLFAAITSGILAVRPDNAKAALGGQAVFNCSSNYSTPTWLYNRNGSEDGALRIASGCVVPLELSLHYRTEPAPNDSTVCNLIVFNVTMEQGGVYMCKHGPKSTLKAILLVYDPRVNLTINNGTEVVRGERLTYSYRIAYSASVNPGPVLEPDVSWMGNTKELTMDYSSNHSENAVWGSVTFAAYPPKLTPITFKLTYIWDYDKDDSEYVFLYPNDEYLAWLNWTTPAFDVLFHVENVGISGPTNISCPDGEAELSCHANGDPPPTYEWMDTWFRTISRGQSNLVVNKDGSYRCIAQNTIRNTTKKADASFTITCGSYTHSAGPLHRPEWVASVLLLVSVAVLVF